MKVALLLLLLSPLLPPFVHADALDDCAEMFPGAGAPESAEGEVDQTVLCRKGYVLAYNPESRVPDWVVELLTPDRFKGDADREGASFVADPTLIQLAAPHAEPRDYKKSGFDQGHMAPAGDMKWSVRAMEESFFLSNVAPQVGIAFNRHVWKYLEEAVRSCAEDWGEVLVITGTYGRRKAIGPNEVEVPKTFFKVVYDPKRQRAAGFKFSNQAHRGADFRDFAVPIREIEEESGLDFFPALSEHAQNVLEIARGTPWKVIKK